MEPDIARPAYTPYCDAMTITGPVLDWLLDADASIRWQVLRHLTDAPDEVVAAERSRVTTEGWGARVLADQ